MRKRALRKDPIASRRQRTVKTLRRLVSAGVWTQQEAIRIRGEFEYMHRPKRRA